MLQLPLVIAVALTLSTSDACMPSGISGCESGGCPPVSSSGGGYFPSFPSSNRGYQPYQPMPSYYYGGVSGGGGGYDSYASAAVPPSASAAMPLPPAALPPQSMSSYPVLLPSADREADQVDASQQRPESLPEAQVEDFIATAAPAEHPYALPRPPPPDSPFQQQIEVESAGRYIESEATGGDNSSDGDSEAGLDTRNTVVDTLGAERRVKQPFLTYHNQLCSGEVLGSSSHESVQTAAQKCALLDCQAVNGRASVSGLYDVVYLKTVSGRSGKKGNYCLSNVKVHNSSRRQREKFQPPSRFSPFEPFDGSNTSGGGGGGGLSFAKIRPGQAGSISDADERLAIAIEKLDQAVGAEQRRRVHDSEVARRRAAKEAAASLARSIVTEGAARSSSTAPPTLLTDSLPEENENTSVTATTATPSTPDATTSSIAVTDIETANNIDDITATEDADDEATTTTVLATTESNDDDLIDSDPDQLTEAEPISNDITEETSTVAETETTTTSVTATTPSTASPLITSTPKYVWPKTLPAAFFFVSRKKKSFRRKHASKA